MSNVQSKPFPVPGRPRAPQQLRWLTIASGFCRSEAHVTCWVPGDVGRVCSRTCLMFPADTGQSLLLPATDCPDFGERLVVIAGVGGQLGISVEDVVTGVLQDDRHDLPGTCRTGSQPLSLDHDPARRIIFAGLAGPGPAQRTG